MRQEDYQKLKKSGEKFKMVSTRYEDFENCLLRPCTQNMVEVEFVDRGRSNIEMFHFRQISMLRS